MNAIPKNDKELTKMLAGKTINFLNKMWTKELASFLETIDYTKGKIETIVDKSKKIRDAILGMKILFP